MIHIGTFTYSKFKELLLENSKTEIWKIKFKTVQYSEVREKDIVALKDDSGPIYIFLFDKYIILNIPVLQNLKYQKICIR